MISSLTWCNTTSLATICRASPRSTTDTPVRPTAGCLGNDVSGNLLQHHDQDRAARATVRMVLAYIPRPGRHRIRQRHEDERRTAVLRLHQWQQVSARSRRRRQDATASMPWLGEPDQLEPALQEILGIFTGRGEIKLDILNFTNLLNKKWATYDIDFRTHARWLISLGIDPATGKHVYSLPTNSAGNYAPGALKLKINSRNRAGRSSRTVRYTF